MNKRVKELIEILLCVIAYAVVLTLLNISCPIKFVTGVSCAGCGMTRAFISLLKGNINEAFMYHPLFILVPIFIGVYLFRDKIPSKVFKIIVGVFITAFIVCYIIRMLNPNDMIVVCDLKESIIYKILKGGI